MTHNEIVKRLTINFALYKIFLDAWIIENPSIYIATAPQLLLQNLEIILRLFEALQQSHDNWLIAYTY